MKTQSKKSKGRRLQKWVREQLIEKLNIHEEDIESRSMGAGGEDLIMARAAREKFPYSIECKNRSDNKQIYSFYKQATKHSNLEPLLVIKTKREKCYTPNGRGGHPKRAPRILCCIF